MALPLTTSDIVSEDLQKFTQRASAFSIILSILLIACGFLAVLVPIASSVGTVIVLSWLLMIAGVVQFVHAFRSQGIGSTVWKIVVAVLYFVTGLYLRANPRLGLAALTLVLSAFFVGEGLMDIVAYIRTRTSGVSGWLLFDGIVTLVLGFMIWRHWPGSSLWVIGTLVGISMIMTGLTRLMLTLAVRRAMKAASVPLPRAA